MLRFLFVTLPVTLAQEAFVDDEGMSLLQLRTDRSSQPEAFPGAEPGPNPIVTQADCRKKAAELGLEVGHPDLDFEVNSAYYHTKGCFTYRYCNKHASSGYQFRWHVFYGYVKQGEDITPEEAAQPTGGSGPAHERVGVQRQMQRIDVPLFLVRDNRPDVCDVPEAESGVPVPPGAADEGEAVGDPHMNYAGHHFDLEQSDLSTSMLQGNLSAVQDPSVWGFMTPGPNPIVTIEQCRQKAKELGFPLGGIPENPGDFLVIDGKGGDGYHWRTKGCFAYRVCSPGSSDFTWLYHVFYGTKDGNDATLEEVSQPTQSKSHHYIDRVVAGDDSTFYTDLELTSPQTCDVPFPTPGGDDSDEGEAVGDPHMNYAGQHRDLIPSDVHH